MGVIIGDMDAQAFAEMTAVALDSMEGRISEDIAELKAELKHGLAELKHGQAELKLQMDVHRRVTEEKLDSGFRAILRHIESG